MQRENGLTTPTSESHDAVGGSATVSQAPTPGEATTTATATSPANQLRARTRRERGKPEFHPTTVYHTPNSEAKANEEIVVPEDTVRLDYEFLLRGGREEVVRVKSQLILPMALALATLPQTESSFPEMIDRVLVQPLNTKFRAFLQRLFDAASRAAIDKEAAEKETPPPANIKRSNPTNGAVFRPDLTPSTPFIVDSNFASGR